MMKYNFLKYWYYSLLQSPVSSLQSPVIQTCMSMWIEATDRRQCVCDLHVECMEMAEGRGEQVHVQCAMCILHMVQKNIEHWTLNEMHFAWNPRFYVENALFPSSLSPISRKKRRTLLLPSLVQFIHYPYSIHCFYYMYSVLYLLECACAWYYSGIEYWMCMYHVLCIREWSPRYQKKERHWTWVGANLVQSLLFL